MSGYGSKHTVRDVVIATLEKEGRNPNAYNIAGIMRDAFYDQGPGYGYGVESEEKWRAAVDQHRRPYGIGDLVRVVLEANGLTEHHYGKIESFRKPNGGLYKGQPVKPHAAYVVLTEIGGRIVPVCELTQAEDDFDVITDRAEVHRGATEYMDWYYKCLGCGSATYKAAEVKIVHKASGQCVRLCRDCNRPERMGWLGHRIMWDGRSNKKTIFELRENPGLIAGPADDDNADSYRQWADCFPYLVPAEAAELYAAWKEKLNASVAS
ncbi:hypothetical protein [Streptomyces chattanoogensis]|uniref:hypothetical protein n=1 Tax=Streptomyces chattanoogensis TaxID=66876 RepID=UPI00369BDF41